MNTHLSISPKFALFLKEKKLLTPLVNSLKIFMEQQNYPFYLKDQRIVKQSVFKAIAELYSQKSEIPDVDKLAEETEKITKRLMEDTLKKKDDSETVELDFEAPEQEDNLKSYELELKTLNKTFQFQAKAKNKEEAYTILLKRHPGLKKSSKSAILKKIKIKK